MSRSKRFRVQYVTSEGSRRLGRNSSLEKVRKDQKNSSKTNHNVEFAHNFKETAWITKCLVCSFNLESSFDELVEAVISAEEHGRITKLTVNEVYESLIISQIEEIRKS